MTYTAPVEDQRFVLEQITDLAALGKLEAFEGVGLESVGSVLEEAGRFFGDVVAPLNRVGDTTGSVRNDDGSITTPPGFRDAYQRYIEAGWPAVPFEPEFGGGGFPWLVGMAIQEMVTSANMAFSLCPMLTQGSIHLLTAHGTPEQQAEWLPKLVTGEWTGTMVMTESQAGSDVGALTTRAVRNDDGTYAISGTKIFITWGEHDLADNIVHLVLARTPGSPPGTRGISTFLVPKVLPDGSHNAVECVSIEHKLGIHASPTCVLSLDGATGHLIGEEHQGIRYMFTMMNTARLAVGLEGLAIAERAYQQALAFAHERRQGQGADATSAEAAPIVVHPDVRRMLLTMKANAEAMRCLIYVNAEAIDLAKVHPDADVRARAQERADLLTPISKAWCTDTGTEMASVGVQVHGGMGYVEETGAAQHLRDARIAQIYEGTNGIQAIDLANRKLSMRNGGVVRDLLDEMRQTPGVEAGVAAVEEATDWLLAAAPADRLAGATPYLRLFGVVVGGWLMARSKVAAERLLAEGTEQEEFLRDKVTTADFYLTQILPTAAGLLPSITAGADALYASQL